MQKRIIFIFSISIVYLICCLSNIHCSSEIEVGQTLNTSDTIYKILNNQLAEANRLEQMLNKFQKEKHKIGVSANQGCDTDPSCCSEIEVAVKLQKRLKECVVRPILSRIGGECEIFYFKSIFNIQLGVNNIKKAMLENKINVHSSDQTNTENLLKDSNLFESEKMLEKLIQIIQHIPNKSQLSCRGYNFSEEYDQMHKNLCRELIEIFSIDKKNMFLYNVVLSFAEETANKAVNDLNYGDHIDDYENIDADQQDMSNLHLAIPRLEEASFILSIKELTVLLKALHDGNFLNNRFQQKSGLNHTPGAGQGAFSA